jgi:pimeloyl-ACP methyl ester carboxylesterase
VTPGDVLGHEIIATPEAHRWALVIHGVFGSLKNWRGFARRLSEACQGWGFVVVDLPGHGGSTAAAPAHDLAAVSAALSRLCASLDRPMHGIIGHSLGGKVALYHALRSGHAFEQVWVLDSRLGIESPERIATASAMKLA